MKSIYLFEAENVNKFRENIVKERLVYLKYLMDNTSNKKEVTKLEKMYNCLYNLNYNVNGRLRSLNDMFTYINQIMTENKGLIPDLPTNDQITTIDEKAKAFKELHKSDFDAYLTRFDKTNIDKAETKKTDDSAKSVLSPENPQDNKKALEEIRKISSVFGLTNIIGLEPTRQASKEDVKRQEELKKQQQDGDPKATQHDKEATQEEPTDKPKEEPAKTEENPDKSEGEPTKPEEPTDKSDKEPTDEEVDEMINELTKDMNDEEVEEFVADFEDMDEDDFEDLDEFKEPEENKDKSGEKESKNENLNISEDKRILKGDRGVVGKAVNIGGDLFKRSIKTALAASWSANVAPLKVIGALPKRAKTRKQMAYLQKQADSAKDPKEKEKLLKQKEAIKLCSFSRDGTYIVDPIQRKARQKDLIKSGKISKDDVLDKKEMKELTKNAKEFAKTPEYKEYKKDAKKDLRKAKLKQAFGVTEIKDFAKQTKEEIKGGNKKEKSVKDKDGSEIIARAKKNGSGTTYVRKKNGKETGYATKDEFQAAQKSATKESYQMKSLHDYLLESLQ